MPKVASSIPETLRPYIFHGIHLQFSKGDDEATAECPFCDSPKFSVNIESGQYRCWRCATGTEKGGGNAHTFIRKLHEASDSNGDRVRSLRENRRLLFDKTMEQWGVVQSATTGDILVPGYGIDGKLNQLYRYTRDPSKNKMVLLPTPGLGHQLHGVPLFDKKKSFIWLCEGPWDAMALWEVLQASGALKDGNVLAVPGCFSFLSHWLPLFQGKIVNLMFDSDHPKKNPKTGQLIEPVGYTAMGRVAGMLRGASGKVKPPNEIRYLRWGPEGFDISLPSGTDLRDVLSGTIETPCDSLSESPVGMEHRIKTVDWLFERLSPLPNEWLTEEAKIESSVANDPNDLQLIPCSSYEDLTNAWKKAMKWTDGLDHALAVMLSSIISTRTIGEQLWIKIISPPSTGKTTLCEGLAVNKEFTLSKSTIRGFHSGFKSDSSGDEDNSLISQLYNKTLITKDGDTLLQSPNLSQILAEGRDIYDGTSRTHYRNKMGKDYKGIRMTWLLCGTNALRSLDQSELGERFLDCVIMEKIDDDLEDEIGWRVANRAFQGLTAGAETNGDMASHYETSLAEAMQLTGGYVDYLCKNCSKLLVKVKTTDETLRRITSLGKFVAFMRARPSSRQAETAEREFSPRLISQLVRLATCLAAVMGRESIDEEVMRRVTQIALDTARGQTLELARYMEKHQATGVFASSIGTLMNWEDAHTRKIMAFLRKIGAVYHAKIEGSRIRWKLTPRLSALYREVVNGRK